MVYNSLAALAVARELNIPIEKAIEGVLNFSPKQQRMEIKKIGNGVIINDTYNAAPESMEAALSVLSDIAEGRRKVAVLADMLEMGSFSEDAHRQLGISCVEHGVDILICMGEFRKQISEGAVKAGMNVNNIYLCNNHNDLVDLLNIVVKKDDAVLVKGSRAMKMEIGVETIIEMWREGEVSVE